MNVFLQLGVATILLVILPIQLQAAPNEITNELVGKATDELLLQQQMTEKAEAEYCPHGCFVFQSKNYPQFYFGTNPFSNTGAITKGTTAHLYNLVRPGLNGRAGTVSFQSCIIPTIYLRHKSFVIHEDSNDGSTLFKYDASFNEHTNYLGQSGYNAYEATNPNLNGFFIRHQFSKLIISTGHLIHPWADQLFKAVRV